ncbi:MAG: CBS domain-containing protein [Bacteroidia bacterium]|nr:CBS domain-containing protein [Bacteroidia bacterium]MCX7653024.1 CBS domain-containing protein [Bacteroidia bacterium]MDW8416162.1 CBS domain-containing protein [Bacteroidia bacterium]
MTLPSLTLASLARYSGTFLHPDAPLREARRLFRKYPYLAHLPIVSEEHDYLALLPRKVLRKASPDTPVKALSQILADPLLPSATVYDALHKMEKFNITEVPIVSDEGKYLGLITTRSLVRWWSHLAAVQEPGAVVILETTLSDYSLAEIAQILESDDIRILSAYLLAHDTDLRRTYIVLKVNSIYLSRSIHLLERKGYLPVAVHGDALMEEQAQKQLSTLLRYLSI